MARSAKMPSESGTIRWFQNASPALSGSRGSGESHRPLSPFICRKTPERPGSTRLSDGSGKQGRIGQLSRCAGVISQSIGAHGRVLTCTEPIDWEMRPRGFSLFRCPLVARRLPMD